MSYDIIGASEKRLIDDKFTILNAKSGVFNSYSKDKRIYYSCHVFSQNKVCNLPTISSSIHIFNHLNFQALCCKNWKAGFEVSQPGYYVQIWQLPKFSKSHYLLFKMWIVPTSWDLFLKVNWDDTWKVLNIGPRSEYMVHKYACYQWLCCF